MATRVLLAELAAAWDGNAAVRSLGGIEAARLMRGGEPVDVVVLAADAMSKLQADGFIVPGSLAAFAVSSMVAAVRTGEPIPALSTADDVKQAILAAKRIGYSTGPSGDHLLRLLDTWSIKQEIGDRLVQAPPGTPVARLLAEGTVELGFQQRREFMHVEGVTIAGPLPPAIAGDTIFTAGVARGAAQPDAARRFMAFMTAPITAPAKRRHGMQPP